MMDAARENRFLTTVLSSQTMPFSLHGLMLMVVKLPIV